MKEPSCAFGETILRQSLESSQVKRLSLPRNARELNEMHGCLSVDFGRRLCAGQSSACSIGRISGRLTNGWIDRTWGRWLFQRVTLRSSGMDVTVLRSDVNVYEELVSP